MVPTPRRRWTRPALLTGALVLLAGCASDAPQDIFQPQGSNARRINDLQVPVFIIAGVVGVIVLGVVAYVMVKFRDRGQDIPEQTHGNPKLEIALTILPAIILAGIAVPTVIDVFKLAKTSDAECVINVTGQQWWWEYDYQTGECGGVKIDAPIVTSGELVIPAKTNVLLRITSRDVIHSYWIPALNGKRDAVPGRLHTLRMQADQPGLYTGQCTEFCGLSHARMRQAAVALDTADFQKWVDNELADYEAPEAGTLAAEGEATFIANCSKCHQVNGIKNADGSPVLSDPDLYVVSGVAPNLSKLMTRTAFAGWTFDLITEECRDKLWNAKPSEFGALYLKGVTPECFDEVLLRDWLRNPPALKPMYVDSNNLESTGGKYRGMPNLNLKEDQIDQLIAYLLERK
ncbi:MAG: cytochrome c oxidase subunit II [Ilumatobacteraceae bacterium]